MDIYIYIYIYKFFGCRSKENKNILKWVGPWRDLYFFRIYSFCSYIHLCFQLDAFIREYVWHKALLMEYSLRLKLTCVCSLNGFQLVMGFYEGHSSLFLSLLYPSFPFDIWYIVCVCVCVGMVSDFTYSTPKI